MYKIRTCTPVAALYGVRALVHLGQQHLLRLAADLQYLRPYGVTP